jgi:hypothetical protein
MKDLSDSSDFYIVNYQHLDEDVYHATSQEVYISQLIKFAKKSKQNLLLKTSSTKLLVYWYKLHQYLKLYHHNHIQF